MKSGMRAGDLRAVLDYLEIDVPTAALAFGKTEAGIRAMLAGDAPVDFLVSALTVLMCESPKATQLAIEHGLAIRDGEPSLADVLANATGVGVLLKRQRPGLRVVKNEPQ